MLGNFIGKYISGNRGVSIENFVNSIMEMSINRREVLEYLEKISNIFYHTLNPFAKDRIWFQDMFTPFFAKPKNSKY